MALYGSIDDAVAILSRVQAVLPTVKKIVMDPYFFEVAKRVKVLYDIEAAKSGAAPSAGVIPGSGLQKLIGPLDALIYLRQNPWAFWLGVGGIIALIGGIGYRIGQRKGSAR